MGVYRVIVNVELRYNVRECLLEEVNLFFYVISNILF